MAEGGCSCGASDPEPAGDVRPAVQPTVGRALCASTCMQGTAGVPCRAVPTQLRPAGATAVRLHSAMHDRRRLPELASHRLLCGRSEAAVRGRELSATHVQLSRAAHPCGIRTSKTRNPSHKSSLRHHDRTASRRANESPLSVGALNVLKSDARAPPARQAWETRACLHCVTVASTQQSRRRRVVVLRCTVTNQSNDVRHRKPSTTRSGPASQNFLLATEATKSDSLKNRRRLLIGFHASRSRSVGVQHDVENAEQRRASKRGLSWIWLGCLALAACTGKVNSGGNVIVPGEDAKGAAGGTRTKSAASAGATGSVPGKAGANGAKDVKVRRVPHARRRTCRSPATPPRCRRSQAAPADDDAVPEHVRRPGGVGARRRQRRARR